MSWWVWVLLGALVLGLLVLIGLRASSQEDRKTISWWAARNGFRYTKGTPLLLKHFRGAPFDRGTSRDLQDVLSGEIAGRPALIVQFSYFRTPTGEIGAPDGLHSGICSAALLELPGAVPELLVRKETTADRARGRDLQLESEQFNAAFRITGTVDRFSYDVLNPRVMEWLLTDPRGQRYSFRFDGPMLVVWREGKLDGAMELGEIADFAATLYGMVPSFVYSAGHPPGQTQVPISQVPRADLGPTPVGTLHFMQHLEHRGHQIERYEYMRKLWGVEETSISVKINVDTVWPVLMIAAKRIASERGRQPRFDDGVTAGHKTFDRLYACGTPRPDFAMLALTKEFTELLLERRDTRSACVVFQSEVLTPQDDGVPEETRRGGVWVSEPGELVDQALADRLTELACDIVEVLPRAVLSYHINDPVPEPPEGGYPNQLPNYFVLPSDRV